MTTRRLLLGWGCALALGAIRPAEARAEQRLGFYNLHTGESVRAVFRADDAIQPQGAAEIARVLRDHRTGEVHSIEPRLLNLLWALAVSLGTDDPYLVISGYRSPRTNATLAAASDGVSRNSLHLQGAAIDVRLERMALDRLHAAAVALRGGGVGLYRRSDFVHLDVGRVRSW